MLGHSMAEKVTMTGTRFKFATPVFSSYISMANQNAPDRIFHLIPECFLYCFPFCTFFRHTQGTPDTVQYAAVSDKT